MIINNFANVTYKQLTIPEVITARDIDNETFKLRSRMNCTSNMCSPLNQKSFMNKYKRGTIMK